MEPLTSTILLFLAAIVALLTYILVPSAPLVILATASAVALAAGIWWHWTQFGTEYRLSTWQEQLRSYASYVLLFVVILLSYAFYAFTSGGGSVATVARNTTARATTVVESTFSTLASTLGFEAAAPQPQEAVTNLGRRNTNRNVNFLA